MAFPKTLDELKAQNYRFDNDANCRGCGDSIEWWITPNGKKLPMNSMDKGSDVGIAHWATCTEADSFRQKA